jgi:hypothetical protein
MFRAEQTHEAVQAIDSRKAVAFAPFGGIPSAGDRQLRDSCLSALRTLPV